jgi:hypothetical protein
VTAVMETTTPTTLEEQVRQILAKAQQNGDPKPGRGELMKETGASEWRVRRVLKQIDSTSTSSPSNPLQVSSTCEQPTTEQAAPEPQPETPPAWTGGESGDALEATTEQALAGGRLVAWLGFMFGSVMSVAANVLHTWLPAERMPPGWSPGVAPQVGAAVWPIGLLISVEVLSRVAWKPGFMWGLVRFGGAGTVAIGSALISYGHLREVLLAWGYDHPGADVGPLVLDGLMVVSGFALLAMGAKQQENR